jgi:hypothetical protein
MERRNIWPVVLGIGVGVGLVVFAVKKFNAACATETERVANDELLDEALDDSFPASDPPSHTPTMGSTVAGEA